MPGRIITVAQQKGGSGKTTVVVNLATALLAQGKSVAVLDTDPQGSLGKWFMKREDELGENEKLHFSTATPWGIAYELRTLTKLADYVIVDTPPKADSDLRPALRAADLVLIPVATSHVDLWAVEAVLDLTERAEKPALMVMTRARPGTRLAADVAEKAAEMQAMVATGAMANRVVYAETLGQGRSVLEAPKSPAHTEVQALVDEIAAILSR